MKVIYGEKICTGFEDINGNTIYVGDIVCLHYREEPSLYYDQNMGLYDVDDGFEISEILKVEHVNGRFKLGQHYMDLIDDILVDYCLRLIDNENIK